MNENNNKFIKSWNMDIIISLNTFVFGYTLGENVWFWTRLFLATHTHGHS